LIKNEECPSAKLDPERGTIKSGAQRLRELALSTRGSSRNGSPGSFVHPKLGQPIHLTAEEPFASALQEVVRKRTSDAQMDSVLAEPRDMAPAYVDGG
jgi:hypothetical protein